MISDASNKIISDNCRDKCSDLNTVEMLEQGACVSCGICKALCPSGAIEYVLVGGSYFPSIGSSCIKCGRCLEACPGIDLEHLRELDAESILDGGQALRALSAWSSDAKVFQNAVSGGIVTELVGTQLDSNLSDAAFLLDEPQLHKQPKINQYRKGDDLSRYQKSKYLQASHEQTINWINTHSQLQAVIVALPCALRGILHAIEIYGLNRDNYLMIGLFCDKTMTINVLDYFANKMPDNETFRTVDFRNKAVGGYPGGVRLYTERSKYDCSRKFRMDIKEYFQPECCLYCLDKLNVFADISVGDDYTDDNANDGHGACSVIIRTERGQRAWDQLRDRIASVPSTMESIVKSQHMATRVKNAYYAEIKKSRLQANGQKERKLSNEAIVCLSEYDKRLEKIEIGKVYPQHPELLEKELKKKNGASAHAKRVLKNLIRGGTRNI